MKIKRFEASSMSEALRDIKKEFGEDAVILSAKNIKKTSLLGKKSSQVVVTAAVDKAAQNLPTNNIGGNMPVSADQPMKEKSFTDNNEYRGINILKRFNPITSTGQKKLKPKIVQLMSESRETPKERYLYELLLKTGVSQDNADMLDSKAAAVLPEENITEQDYRTALCQVLEASGVVGHSGNNPTSGQRVLVMLGPSGVGKTSATAKLCAKHILQYQHSVAMVSLDNQRVAGASELERYARILEAPLKTACDPGQMNAAMAELKSYDIIIVDTPGMAGDDHVLCEKIRRIVASVNNPECYLLLSAETRERTMARTVSFFRPFDIERLIFTRLDWAADAGGMINQALASNLPIAYFSDSPIVPDGIQFASGNELTGKIIPEKHSGAMDGRQVNVTVIKNAHAASDGSYYVANRNSDIFHLNNCKSVKRINTDNMIVFKDPAEAMEQQFKPCRMCCSELIFPKTINRPVRGYAGSRY